MSVRPKMVLFPLLLLTMLFGGPGSTNARAASKGDFYEYIFCPARRDNPRNSEAAILKLKDQRLLLAWTDFTTMHASDWGPSYIAAMTSSDGGHSWDHKFTVQKNIGKMNTMEPNLLRLKSGKILFIFVRKNSASDCAPMWRISSDDGKTWSPPKLLRVRPFPAYWEPNHDRAIQLKSGRILMPLPFTDDWNIHPHVRTQVYYSDDEGATWKGSRTIVDVKQSKVGADEPGVVELKDGRVMMWIRTDTGHPYQCYSTDSGETWSTPVPMTVNSPDSPQSIKRIPSTGDLLMVWNNSRPGHPNDRFPLSVATSKDDGRTWEHVKKLDAQAGDTYAYTSITFVDRRVLFTYYVTPNKPPSFRLSKLRSVPVRSLKLKSVPVSWFYQ